MDKACEVEPHTLVTVTTLDFAPVLGLRALFAEMPHLLTVAASDRSWVAGLVTLFAHMSFFAAITAGIPPTSRAVLGKVTHYWPVRRQISA